MTIDFNLDFDSNTKETIFKFNDKHDNGKIIEYKFRNEIFSRPTRHNN